jgi:hypothetical protein
LHYVKKRIVHTTMIILKRFARHTHPVFFFLILMLISFSCRQEGGKENNTEKNVKKPDAGMPKAKPQQDTTVIPQKNPKTVPGDRAVNSDTILGAWIRPDGNYILEFVAINADNKVEANYYNPRPIQISMAHIKKEDRIKIYIEFDDTNYRGSYYDLQYDPANDALTGNYYQATYGQTYPIAFIRYEEPL